MLSNGKAEWIPTGWMIGNHTILVIPAVLHNLNCTNKYFVCALLYINLIGIKIVMFVYFYFCLKLLLSITGHLTHSIICCHTLLDHQSAGHVVKCIYVCRLPETDDLLQGPQTHRLLNNGGVKYETIPKHLHGMDVALPEIVNFHA